MATTRKHIKVTYSSLSSPDPLLHEYYEEDITKLKQDLGKTYPMYINGQWVETGKTFTKRTPIDLDVVIGEFHEAGTKEVNEAVAAAKAAFPAWRDTSWEKRTEILERVAEIISERLVPLAAAVSLEIGKNRLEAVGEIEEAADLIRHSAKAMRDNKGFIRPLASESERYNNRSVLKPYGVWGIIAPFNFPAALSAGPAGTALIAGNTVVVKPADDAPLTTYLMAQCFHDAGLPAGTYNLVVGGDEPGKALVANNDVDGITFTGSYPVGMSILRNFSTSKGYMRPVILEMGGKNPAIITKNADLDRAVLGVTRSAFGLSGQKCSACSRVFVHKELKQEFTKRLVKATEELVVGDPTEREVFMGPVVNEAAYKAYQNYVEELSEGGKILTGGHTLDRGNGYYVAPTVVDELPDDHRLWKHEMFSPIVTIREYEENDEAMRLANDIELGLTAGVYSQDDGEVEWFMNNIQAGVLYANREAGATTGAWPGYQTFGGWKGSTGTGKSAMGFYYILQYMRDQSQTVVS